MNSFLLSVNNSFRSLILFSNPLYVVVEQRSKTNWGKKSWIVEFEFTCPGNTWWLSIVGNTPKHRLRLLDRHRRERNLSRCNLLGFKSRFNCNFLFSHCLLSSSKLVARTQTPTELTRRRTTRKNNNRFAEPKRTSFTLSSFSFQRILFHYSTTLTSSFPRVLIVAKPSFAPLHLPILDIPSLHVETFPPIQS